MSSRERRRARRRFGRDVRASRSFWIFWYFSKISIRGAMNELGGSSCKKNKRERERMDQRKAPLTFIRAQNPSLLPLG